MSLGELIAVTGTMASILGIFLTISTAINNRTLREESQHTREILARIEQGQNEARKEMAEARSEMAEAIRHLADLIQFEGEKTRQTIRTPS